MAGRPPTYSSDDERPISVSLRIPKALYAQAQRRVQQRRMTLTEALLEGLQLWLDTPTDPRELLLSDDSNTVIRQLREELKDALLDELRRDVQTLLASTLHSGLTQSPHTALPTHDIPLAQHDGHPMHDDILSDNGNTVLQENRKPDFDATKYRLGSLCPQGHDYHGTGQSLRRRTKGDCVACERLGTRQRRQRRKAQKAGLR